MSGGSGGGNTAEAVRRHRAAVIDQSVRLAFGIVTVLVLLVGVITWCAFSDQSMPQNFTLAWPADNAFVISALIAVCVAMVGAYLSIAQVLRITIFTALRGKRGGGGGGSGGGGGGDDEPAALLAASGLHVAGQVTKSVPPATARGRRTR